METKKPYLSTITIQLHLDEDGSRWELHWDQGEVDVISLTEELWDNAYAFFIPPGQNISTPGNIVKIGPFEMEYQYTSSLDTVKTSAHYFKLIFKEQKGSYQIRRNEDKWTKIN